MSPDAPALSLSVQYGTEAVELPRWRLRRWVTQAVAGVAQGGAHGGFSTAAFTLRLVDAEEGRALNHAYRGKDYATNVLTFEYGTDQGGTASGDIVLCMPVLRREAAEQGKPLLHHAAHLVVHGVLHALGYDHLDDDEAREMEALEVAILAAMGLPNPYQ
ncbi:rRNA maturation RNase YbeY [Pusillimonas sp. TS35]|uniref:rRNA maturation RNase YbeY n=1 Tax=Paracandidimonas lactea TaxID=2895524 RepID=UPI00136F49BF|nr:rRNA maturation RNase YbeY [Paracandidimonas lactea]MYN13173.1 rRNA maturation RNase YbeY [Pusillimonas sp. TS35]